MLKLKLQYFGHLMWRDSLLEKILMLGKIEGKRRRERKRMRWLDSITNSMDLNLTKFWETVEDRGDWRAVVHGVSKSWTWLSDWTAIQLLQWCPCIFKCVLVWTIIIWSSYKKNSCSPLLQPSSMPPTYYSIDVPVLSYWHHPPSCGSNWRTRMTLSQQVLWILSLKPFPNEALPTSLPLSLSIHHHLLPGFYHEASSLI